VETCVAPSQGAGRVGTGVLPRVSAALENPHPALELDELVYRSARLAHDQYRYAGLRYLSRLNTGWECWAVFDRVSIVELARGTIKAEDATLLKVAKMYKLRVY
jgi:hypothetical protein